MTTYSFTLIVSRYNRVHCHSDDMTSIYNHKTCLIAKNAKQGKLYIHPTGKIIKGRFAYSAGSIRYPILIAEPKGVHIRFENFPYKPNDIRTDQINKQDIIQIVDLTENHYDPII